MQVVLPFHHDGAVATMRTEALALSALMLRTNVVAEGPSHGPRLTHAPSQSPPSATSCQHSPVRTETYRFDADGICAQDSDVLVVVDGPKFGGTFNINGKKLSDPPNELLEAEQVRYGLQREGRRLCREDAGVPEADQRYP